MKKIYFLKTCDTCKRILKTIPLDGFTLQEIKTETITVNQLEEMKELSGSYESLFSRRSQKYKSMDLKNEKLTVIIIDSHIFIGNSKSNLEQLSQFFKNK